MPNNIIITPASAYIEFSGATASNISLSVASNGDVVFNGADRPGLLKLSNVEKEIIISGAVGIGDYVDKPSVETVIAVGKIRTEPTKTLYGVSSKIQVGHTATNTTKIHAAGFLDSYVDSTNTANWNSTGFPLMIGVAGGVGVETGSSGTIRMVAGVYSVVGGAFPIGTGATLDEAVMFCGASSNEDINYLVGTKITSLNRGVNNTGVYLGISQDVYPATGNFGIYDNSGYNSYFNGSIGIGTSSPSQKLHVVGSALITEFVGIGDYSNKISIENAIAVGRIRTEPTKAVYGVNSKVQVGHTATNTTKIHGGGFFDAYIDSTNTANWTMSGYPMMYGITGGVGVETGSSGTIRMVAGVYSVVSGAYPIGTGATLDEAILFCGDPANADINYLVGTKITGLNKGVNNTGIYLGITQHTYPATGNFGIYDNSGYNSYFNGSIGIGTSSPSYPLDVNGIINASSTYNIRGTQIVYLPDQTSFTGTLFIGNGGAFLNNATTGDGGTNTGVGIDAVQKNTTGRQNTGVGSEALRDTTTGTRNTGVGQGALRSNTTGSNNNAIGQGALFQNTTGVSNNAMGYQSLYNNSTGSSNTAVGSLSLTKNTTGGQNVAVGVQAVNWNLIGQRIVGVGTQALFNTTADHSVGIGYRAGYEATTGANNIFIGYQAGDNVTTGANNIILGYNIDAPSATASNQLNIGNAIYGNLSTGSIGIKTSSPGAAFHVQAGGTTNPSFTTDIAGIFSFTSGNSNLAIIAANTAISGLYFGDTDSQNPGKIIYDHSVNAMVFSTNSIDHMTLDASGDLSVVGDIVDYASDERLKKNINRIENALNKIAYIGGYTFDWDQELVDSLGFTPYQYENEHGFLAQRVQTMVPDAVRPAPFNKSYLTVKYERLVPLAFEGINALRENNDQLKDRVTNLEKEMTSLKALLKDRGLL